LESAIVSGINSKNRITPHKQIKPGNTKTAATAAFAGIEGPHFLVNPAIPENSREDLSVS